MHTRYFIEPCDVSFPTYSNLAQAFEKIKPKVRRVDGTAIRRYKAKHFIKREISGEYLAPTRKNTSYELFHVPRKDTAVDFAFLNERKVQQLMLEHDRLYVLEPGMPYQMLISGQIETFTIGVNKFSTLNHNLIECPRFEEGCFGREFIKGLGNTVHTRKNLKTLYDRSCGANYRKCKSINK